jgi:hypothetical protein
MYALEQVTEDEGSPFQEAMNLAVLLQTLDWDGDVSHGIEITDAVAALFVGISPDFQQPWNPRSRDPAFRGILNQANSDSLLQGPGGVRKPWLAMQHLYATLGIDNNIYATIRDGYAEDADGIADYIDTWQYDASGNLILVFAT